MNKCPNCNKVVLGNRNAHSWCSSLRSERTIHWKPLSKPPALKLIVSAKEYDYMCIGCGLWCDNDMFSGSPGSSLCKQCVKEIVKP